MSNYSPTFSSPIKMPPPRSLASLPSTEVALGVSDLSGVQATLIQGQADDLLEKHFSTLPARPGNLVEAGPGLLARLTPAELYLFGK